MNVYVGEWGITGFYQYYEEEMILIKANTKKEALGFALEYKKDSFAKDWYIYDVNDTKDGWCGDNIIFLSANSSC